MSQLPNVINGLTQLEKLTVLKDFSTSFPFLTMANVPAGFVLSGNNSMHRQHLKDLQSGTVATRRAPIFVAYQDCTIIAVRGVITQTAAIGAATVSIDLLKNGTTILTTPIALTSATALRSVVVGALSSTALVAGDVLEVSVTATASGGTLPVGLITDVLLDEEPN